MKLYMYDKNKTLILNKTYYSIGGGDILDDEKIKNIDTEDEIKLPFEEKGSNIILNLSHGSQ